MGRPARYKVPRTPRFAAQSYVSGGSLHLKTTNEMTHVVSFYQPNKLDRDDVTYEAMPDLQNLSASVEVLDNVEAASGIQMLNVEQIMVTLAYDERLNTSLQIMWDGKRYGINSVTDKYMDKTFMDLKCTNAEATT